MLKESDCDCVAEISFEVRQSAPVLMQNQKNTISHFLNSLPLFYFAHLEAQCTLDIKQIENVLVCPSKIPSSFAKCHMIKIFHLCLLFLVAQCYFTLRAFLLSPVSSPMSSALAQHYLFLLRATVNHLRAAPH